jgi:hypothetical protein
MPATATPHDLGPSCQNVRTCHDRRRSGRRPRQHLAEMRFLVSHSPDKTTGHGSE